MFYLTAFTSSQEHSNTDWILCYAKSQVGLPPRTAASQIFGSVFVLPDNTIHHTSPFPLNLSIAEENVTMLLEWNRLQNGLHWNWICLDKFSVDQSRLLQLIGLLTGPTEIGLAVDNNNAAGQLRCDVLSPWDGIRRNNSGLSQLCSNDTKQGLKRRPWIRRVCRRVERSWW